MSDQNSDDEIHVLFLGSNFPSLTSARMIYYFYDLYLTYNKNESAKLLNPEFFWLQLDVRSDFKANLKKIIKYIKPNFLVNFISLRNPVKVEKPHELSYQINVSPNTIIIDLCQEFSIHPILISTDYVFDGLKGPYLENSPISPIFGFTYGEQRAMAESIFLPLIEEGRASIIRTSTLLGFPEPYLKQNIYSTFYKNLLKGSQIKGAINKYRTPTHAYNLGFMINKILTMEGKNAGGIYHVPGEYMNEFELFQRMAKSLNFNPNLIISYEINDKIQLYPLKTGLKSTETHIKFLNFAEGLTLLAKQVQKMVLD